MNEGYTTDVTVTINNPSYDGVFVRVFKSPNGCIQITDVDKKGEVESFYEFDPLMAPALIKAIQMVVEKN